MEVLQALSKCIGTSFAIFCSHVRHEVFTNVWLVLIQHVRHPGELDRDVARDGGRVKIFGGDVAPRSSHVRYYPHGNTT